MGEDRRASLIASMDEIIKGFSGELGVATKNLGTGEQVLVNENRVFATASSAKIWVLVEIFKQAEEKRLALDQRVSLKKEDQIPGSGILQELEPELELTVRDLATLMMVVSDNTATNMCIDLLGIDNIRRTMRDLGLADSRLNGKIDFSLIIDNPCSFGEATCADFARLMELIARRRILTPTSCDAIVNIMARNQYLDYAPRLIPYNPFAGETGDRQDVIVANKPGWVEDVHSDVLLVRHHAVEYVVAIMSDGCKDERWNADNEGSLVLARISRLIYDYFISPNLPDVGG